MHSMNKRDRQTDRDIVLHEEKNIFECLSTNSIRLNASMDKIFLLILFFELQAKEESQPD